MRHATPSVYPRLPGHPGTILAAGIHHQLIHQAELLVCLSRPYESLKAVIVVFVEVVYLFIFLSFFLSRCIYCKFGM